MNDDDLDDIVRRAAVVRDADLHSPAVHAAVDAALEKLVTMPPDATRVPARPAPGGADEIYAPERPRRASGPRPLLTAAAALIVLAVAAVGLGYARLDRSGDRTQEPTDTTAPGSTATTSTTTPTTAALPPLPPVVHPPPDPATAPPADAPFAERLEFAFRTSYLDNIQHEVWLEADGSRSIEFWRDQASASQRSLLYTPGGGPAGGAPVMDDVSVAGQSCDGTGPGLSPVDAPTVSDRLVEELRSGALVEDGRETIDGRDTIRLRYTDGFAPARMWVDATTLWQVRQTTKEGYTITHEFLPRTPANFANVTDGRC
jgi:hypothetical protein